MFLPIHVLLNQEFKLVLPFFNLTANAMRPSIPRRLRLKESYTIGSMDLIFIHGMSLHLPMISTYNTMSISPINVRNIIMFICCVN